MKPNPICLMAATLALAGCEAVNQAASQAASDFQQTMQQAHDANAALSPSYVVRGRVPLRDGQTLTCFEGIPSGYLGRSDLKAPAEAVTDPRTGRLTVRTAAIPATILSRSGTLASNVCDQLARDGLLEGPGAAAATSTAAARLPPRTRCRDVPPAQQADYRMCVSFDSADHCSALPIDGSIPNGMSDLTAICDARKTQSLWEREQAFQRGKAGAGRR